jgi:hypothetical protein
MSVLGSTQFMGQKPLYSHFTAARANLSVSFRRRPLRLLLWARLGPGAPKWGTW